MSHAKRCPQCGHVGSYEAAALLVCEGCGEVLAESWALGDAVTDIMEEGSWIHQFRQAEGAGVLAVTVQDPSTSDGIPGLIGPGSGPGPSKVAPRTGASASDVPSPMPALVAPLADSAIPGLLVATPAIVSTAPPTPAAPPKLPPFPPSDDARRALALTNDLVAPASTATPARPDPEPTAHAQAGLQPSVASAQAGLQPSVAPAQAGLQVASVQAGLQPSVAPAQAGLQPSVAPAQAGLQPSAAPAQASLQSSVAPAQGVASAAVPTPSAASQPSSPLPRIVLGRAPSDLLVVPSAARGGAP
ncbi:hypothetical protein L6R52_33370, partial [Myxococcota bacterium]|nr:hypothetical protein [Myxococcota bacterium]